MKKIKLTTAIESTRHWILSGTPARMFLTLFFSIFIGETLIMMLINVLPPLPRWNVALLDSVSLLIAVFPVYYFFVFSPLATQNAARKRAEDALRESVVKYRTLFETNQAGVFRSTVDGEFLEYNLKFAQMMGYVSAEEMKGTNSRTLYFSDSDRNTLITRLQMDGKLENYELLVKRRDGSPMWILESVSFVDSGDGKKVMQGTAIDITGRKQAEEKLRQLSNAVEQSSASIIITDKSGAIQYVNPYFTQVTGYTREEVTGCNPRLLKSGEMPPEGYQKMWAEIMESGVWRGEFHNRRKNGELFWERATISAIKDDHGQATHFVAVKEDITEQKATREKMERMETLATLGKFSAMTAHEIRNPMSWISANLQIMKTFLTDKNTYEKIFEDMFQGIERIKQIINNIIVLSRPEIAVRSECDLGKITETAIQSISEKLPSTISIQKRYDPEKSYKLLCDQNQVQQVMVNLIANAVKRMAEGGEIVIELKSEKENTSVVIKDSGSIMTAQDLQNAREPFFATGTGDFEISWAVIHRIILNHNARMVIESETNSGTIITLTFQ